MFIFPNPEPTSSHDFSAWSDVSSEAGLSILTTAELSPNTDVSACTDLTDRSPFLESVSGFSPPSSSLPRSMQDGETEAWEVLEDEQRAYAQASTQCQALSVRRPSLRPPICAWQWDTARRGQESEAYPVPQVSKLGPSVQRRQRRGIEAHTSGQRSLLSAFASLLSVDEDTVALLSSDARQPKPLFSGACLIGDDGGENEHGIAEADARVGRLFRDVGGEGRLLRNAVTSQVDYEHEAGPNLVDTTRWVFSLPLQMWQLIADSVFSGSRHTASP